jgi:hypothetical protein
MRQAGFNLQMDLLKNILPNAIIHYFQVPGAFDISIVANISPRQAYFSPPLIVVTVEAINNGSAQLSIQSPIDDDEVLIVNDIGRWRGGNSIH